MAPSIEVDAQHSTAHARQARALEHLQPTSPHYATIPILEGFNWAPCLDSLPGVELYLVVFRSYRRADADEATLLAADELAHQNAMRQPGFLYYFKGALDDGRSCLSFCVWTDQAAAQHAGRQPEHQAAMRITAAMYESYMLERYFLSKPNAGPIKIVPVGILQASPDRPAHEDAARHLHQGPGVL